MLWGAAGGALFTTLTSKNLSNVLKGEGFYTNESVFNNMIERGADKQAMLDYFGFEGAYNPGLTSKNYQANDYWGATNSKTGQISYGNHEIIKGIREDLNNEALRVAKLINFDRPAMQRGKPIKVKYTVPVEFKLEKKTILKK